MEDGGVLVCKASNPRTGLNDSDLGILFYGDGRADGFGTDKHALISWEVVDSEDKMDTFQFTLDNPTLRLIDDPRLAKGNLMRVQFGYPTNLSEVREFVITGRRGWRELTIFGELNSESKLATGVSNEKFENKSIAEVARILFSREGLKAEVDESDPISKKTQQVIQKTNETSFQFLRRMSTRLGLAYEVYVEGDVGYFRPKQFKETPSLLLKYGTENSEDDFVTIDDPTLNDSQTNTAIEETFRGQDLMNKKALEAKGNNANSKQTSLGKGTYYFDAALGKFKSKGPSKTADTGRSRVTSRQTIDEVQGMASSAFDKKAAKANSITWSIIGNPKIASKTTVQITCGVASIDGARWYLDEVRHQSEGGDYSTHLSLISNAVGKAVGTVEATPEGPTNVKSASENNSKEVKYKFDSLKGKFTPTNIGIKG